jgi:hypothetical protein
LLPPAVIAAHWFSASLYANSASRMAAFSERSRIVIVTQSSRLACHAVVSSEKSLSISSPALHAAKTSAYI